jgi:hypothetical protein
VDGSGVVTVYGDTESTNFPVSPGALQAALAGASDLFLTRLDPTASTPVFSTYLGGSDAEFSGGMAVDSNGNIHLAGNTASTDFKVSSDAYQPQVAGDFDAFYVRLDPAAKGIQYATYIGGSDYESEGWISVDAAGNVYVGGATQSSNFPTVGALQGMQNGTTNGYVFKFAPQ